jgi:S-formylglutathione hydrolase FrmB
MLGLKTYLLWIFAVGFGSACFYPTPGLASVSIEVILGTNVATEPVSGRLYVLMNSDTVQLPLYGPNSSDPQPFFSKDVSGWRPGDTIRIDGTWNFWQHSLEDLAGDYSISAVLDLDSTRWGFINAGNIMSVKKVVHIESADTNPISVKLEAMIVDYPFTETETLKELIIPSSMLSDWYGYPIELTAGVILPASYRDSTSKRYPVVYVFPGWGASRLHLCMGTFNQDRYGMFDDTTIEKIYIFMDHQCPHGYHVFANSANNGPRAKSFIDEFIPEVDKRFRTVAEPEARFLIGQSSGGWAALYLQVTYPEYFGGAWAGSPDPVDFRFFEGIGNIYEHGANFFYKEDGSDKPHSGKNGKMAVTSRAFSDMEVVLGIGGQLDSYESVFSPRAADGLPTQLFDRTTGAIDSATAASWRAYDLRAVISCDEPDRRSKYIDKLHIFVAQNDDYYLNLAVSGLEKALEDLGANADVRVLDAGGHSVWNDEIRARMDEQMDSIFLHR